LEVTVPAACKPTCLALAALTLLSGLHLAGCSGGEDIQPGISAAGVRLGDGREAVEKVLGKPESTSSSGVHGATSVETTYLLYPSRGIDVLLEGNKVLSIFLYNEGVDEHKKYPGKGPSGITLSSKRDEVIAALGEPGARGLGTNSDLWFRYDEGLEAIFERDGTIHHLIVTRPH
jgi:hypothetical protein